MGNNILKQCHRSSNDSSNIKIKTNTQANKLKVLIPEGILRDVSGNYVIEDVMVIKEAVKK